LFSRTPIPSVLSANLNLTAQCRSRRQGASQNDQVLGKTIHPIRASLYILPTKESNRKLGWITGPSNPMPLDASATEMRLAGWQPDLSRRRLLAASAATQRADQGERCVGKRDINHSRIDIAHKQPVSQTIHQMQQANGETAPRINLHRRIAWLSAPSYPPPPAGPAMCCLPSTVVSGRCGGPRRAGWMPTASG
jgi:hypothetical protein